MRWPGKTKSKSEVRTRSRIALLYPPVYGEAEGTRVNNGSSSRVTGERLHSIEADQVQVDRSAVRSIDAEQVRLERAAVQRLRAGHATIERSAVGVASFGQATLAQSTTGVVVARSAACDEARIGVLIAPVVRGDIHTWFDMRSAVAVGVGVVLAKTMVGLVRTAVRRASA